MAMSMPTESHWCRGHWWHWWICVAT